VVAGKNRRPQWVRAQAESLLWIAASCPSRRAKDLRVAENQGIAVWRSGASLLDSGLELLRDSFRR